MINASLFKIYGYLQLLTSWYLYWSRYGSLKFSTWQLCCTRWNLICLLFEQIVKDLCVASRFTFTVGTGWSSLRTQDTWCHDWLALVGCQAAVPVLRASHCLWPSPGLLTLDFGTVDWIQNRNTFVGCKNLFYCAWPCLADALKMTFKYLVDL